jgi:hypothetical protein
MNQSIFNNLSKTHTNNAVYEHFWCVLSIFCMLVISSDSFAQEESEDEAMARMQAQLNQEVMSKPFLAEKPKEVDAYIKNMMAKKITPPE